MSKRLFRTMVISYLTFSLTLPAVASGRGPGPGGTSSKQTKQQPIQQAPVVNINTAVVDQLTLLPGIGVAKAGRIIAYRKRRKFKRTIELVRVRGIGRKTFRKLRAFLSTSGATTATKKLKIKKGK